MANNLMGKYQKMDYKSDYFGGGKNAKAKARRRRWLKKNAINHFNADAYKSNFQP